MRSALLAFVLFAGCTPDADGFPLMPGSTNVPASGGVGNGGFGGGSDVADAGVDFDGGGIDGDGGIDLDGGLLNDGGAFLDGPPADAAALLPDAQTDFPPFP